MLPIPTDPVAASLQAQALAARAKALSGQIDREAARTQIQPYIDYVNEKAKVIAKKYGVKPKQIGFAGFMR